MALYKLILAYDGTSFSGFQRQGKTRTVQGVFEEALRELGWQEKAILFAGRTDAGVHASGQVVSFGFDWQHSSASLASALNARLPDDVSAVTLEETEAEFHPRYDASSRRYHYTIYHHLTRLPIKERYAWRIWPELNGEHLNTAASVFIGRHDFSAFGRAMKKGNSTIREVFASQWHKEPQGWRYEIEANAFLYHMVRRLVFVQVGYAKGSLSLEELQAGLEEQKLIKPGLAPAQGLELTQVRYDGKTNRVTEDEKN
jgi:tRNA pseudouridine38-40 synthase